jgi:Fic family protein
VNQETIFTLHYLLSDGLVEREEAGHVRDHGVRISASVYVPFEGAKQLQIRLERVLGKAACIEDPYEQSLFLLVHISYLQAFIDVNKRTARLSANIPLIKNNLVPLSFNDVDKDGYISAMLAIYELQNVGPLLDLYRFSYTRTCCLYDTTVETLGFDEVRVRLRQERRAVIREIIVQKLTGAAMDQYVASESAKRVTEEDRENFVEDVHEDLKFMTESHLYGLGVTVEQLREWKKVLP